jgi:hypothetical protein
MQAASLRGLQRAVLAWQQEIVRTLTRYLRDAGVANPDARARLLFAEIDGVAQHFVLDPGGYPLEDQPKSKFSQEHRSFPQQACDCQREPPVPLRFCGKLFPALACDPVDARLAVVWRKAPFTLDPSVELQALQRWIE